MKLTTFPKEIAAEILIFIAENEALPAFAKFEDLHLDQVRVLLKEMAEHLRVEVAKEMDGAFNYKDSELSEQAKQVIGCLSPREERVLLKSFGVR